MNCIFPPSPGIHFSLTTKKNDRYNEKSWGSGLAQLRWDKKGNGYGLYVTERANGNDIPVPVLLPLVSVGYGLATFQMTCIPGTCDNGNVYFAWMRFQF